VSSKTQNPSRRGFVLNVVNLIVLIWERPVQLATVIRTINIDYPIEDDSLESSILGSDFSTFP